jgi:hypothetical protein
MLVALMLVSTLAAAQDSTPKPLKGDYQIYGGSLGDMQTPTAKDRKIAFMLTGPLAKDLFSRIGPDLKDACGAAPGFRQRQRGDLSCTSDKDGYRCYVGMDIVTGKSMEGSIC